LIAVGDPLGKRFTVSRAPDEERTGALFEVIDRDAAVVTAQLLGVTPSATEHLADLRPVLGAVPSNSSLLRPREITVNRASLPVAIFPVASLVPVGERLARVVPGAELVVLDGGHFLHADCAPALTRELARFAGA